MTPPAPLRILVIDDEHNILEVTRVALEVLGGHQVTTAATAREGLSIAQAAPPDVVLMDVNLVDMPAREAIHALGANPATARVPVVLFTGEHADATAGLRQQPNVAGFIAKPFTVARLSDQVRRLVHPVEPSPA